MSHPAIPLDVLIFGGGVAGLWLLDDLRRAGYSVLLAENNALGAGQTVGSQGIIHGGLKYMFDGNLNPAARAVSEMPVIWRDALDGKREPDLRGVPVRSDGCYIWGTGSIKSRIFLAGSTVALRAAPQPVDRADVTAALKEVPGKVMKVAEPVLDTVRMVERFAARNREQLVLIDHSSETTFRRDGDAWVVVLPLSNGNALEVAPKTIIFTAGEGNAALRRQAGLPEAAMQRRPLHMVMARSKSLPDLFGHCVGGPKPRITVTTARDAHGRVVWQIGGQIAEDGVNMDAPDLIEHAKDELRACLPGVNLADAEFTTYRIDRAEAATSTGQKPDDAHVIHEGSVITAFPTKLALAPRLAERVKEVIGVPGGTSARLPELPRPGVALPPWEQHAKWMS